jgi:hypothetical protein
MRALACSVNSLKAACKSQFRESTPGTGRSNVSSALVFATLNALDTDIPAALVRHPCRPSTQFYQIRR